MIPVYAYFLPQFYSIPENDKYWGKGFTEWTNVRNSKPRFEGHKNPMLPQNGDFYDLSEPKEAKRILHNTREIGLDGIVYWYYWFKKGKRALEKVPEIHLKNPSIPQNFFFAWANSDWTGSWVGKKNDIIFKQRYNLEHIESHIDDLLPFFEDERYLKIDSNPLFQVNAPHHKKAEEYILALNDAFTQRTGSEIHWVFPTLFLNSEILSDLKHFRIGFPPEDVFNQKNVFKRRKKWSSVNPWKKPVVTSIEEYTEWFRLHLNENMQYPNFCPTILSGWDTTYRYENSGNVVSGSIEDQVRSQMEVLKEVFNIKELPFILVKAYNEWAEGNILENYTLHGKEYDISHLVKDVIKNDSL
ncbi:glycoside hydrolase family 99-like domain-containing protein [Gracilimonas tropica]|uniref:glycoside hydrolase family 99-like domain-containing protein n=1 Tax=Gracilimonas tropica TaxID=454600 RepID=UPI0003722EED|nr:glycoside hydrolase family 99-like domain-containing protein [Gracilimonas tropica]